MENFLMFCGPLDLDDGEVTCWQHSKVFLLQRLSHLGRQKLKLPPKGASAKALVLKYIMFGVLSMILMVINF